MLRTSLHMCRILVSLIDFTIVTFRSAAIIPGYFIAIR